MLRILLTSITIISLIPAVLAEQSVIISKVGAGTMIIFTGQQPEQKGSVNIGRTIQIRYWLRIAGNKPRFIALDGSSLTAKEVRKFNPIVTEAIAGEKKRWSGGFYIKSSLQSNLNITISKDLWEKVRDVSTKEQLTALEKTLSREANLNVIIEQDGSNYRILNVVVN